MNTPLVTVITPTYNRGNTYLRETMDSVLAQDYPNFEYIVLDDGSTDNTRELLATYDDVRLRWESHDNMGVIKTLNKGFDMAHGDYITVVNSDDPLLPGHLSAAVAFMEAQPDLLAAYPDWQHIDGDGNLVGNVQVSEFDFGEMVKKHYCMPGPGTLLRRKVFDYVDNYKTEFPTIFDFEFYLRVGLYGALNHKAVMARIPKTLATYREHGTTITSSNRGEAIAREHRQIIEDVFNTPDLPQQIKAVQNEAFCIMYYVAGLKCLPEPRHLARQYFIKSITASLLSTRQAHGGFFKQWQNMLRVIVLPESLRRLIAPVRSLLRRT